MKHATSHPVLRWLSVVLRSLHLVAVIGLGAALLGASLSSHLPSMGVLVTGMALFAIDLRTKPQLLQQWSGAALVIKLCAIGLMAFSPELRAPLFWGVIVWSAIFAHAPASFRHARWRSGNAKTSDTE